MKFFSLLWNESKGIRLSAFLLAVLSLFSLYVTVQVTGKLRYTKRQYDFAEKSQLEEAYFFNAEGLTPDSFADPEEYYGEFIQRDGMGEILRTLAEREEVGALGTMAGEHFWDKKYHDPEGKFETAAGAPSVSVRLISPGMLELFPALKEKMPFDDPAAVYLFGDYFPNVKKGERIEIFARISSESDGQFQGVEFLSLPVEGILQSPLTLPSTNKGGSQIDVELITSECEYNTVFMLETPENIAMLAEKSISFIHNSGFYLEYRADATEAQKKATEASLSAYGRLVPLRELAVNLQQTLRQKYAEQLPLSLVLLGITTVTYISVIALTVSKKRKETAVEYLCGCSKNRLAANRTVMLFLVSFLPTVANLLYVLFANYLAEKNMIMLYETVIDLGTALLLLLYSAAMLLVTWLLVHGLMGRRSPIAYFKEATK